MKFTDNESPDTESKKKPQMFGKHQFAATLITLMGFMHTLVLGNPFRFVIDAHTGC